MRERKTFSLLAVIIAILLMSVAYATIQQTLTITGNVIVAPDQSNFNVGIGHVSSDSGIIINQISDGKINMTVSISIGVGTSGTGTGVGTGIGSGSKSAQFEITNTSEDLVASLSCSITNTNTTYFEYDAKLSKTELQPGETAILTVTIRLKKMPTTSQTDSVKITVTSSPKES